MVAVVVIDVPRANRPPTDANARVRISRSLALFSVSVHALCPLWERRRALLQPLECEGLRCAGWCEKKKKKFSSASAGAMASAPAFVFLIFSPVIRPRTEVENKAVGTLR